MRRSNEYKQLAKRVARIKRLIESGYEVDCKGKLVHRTVCRKAHGSFPKDWVVHHIDENKKNNSPDNLIAMPRQLHSRVHEAAKKLPVPLNRLQIEKMIKSYVDITKRREPKIVIVISPQNQEVSIHSEVPVAIP